MPHEEYIDMAKKKTRIDQEASERPPGRVLPQERYVTYAEFEFAIGELKNKLDAMECLRSSQLEFAPRPPVHHKRKAGRRYKLASTIDGTLYDKIRDLEAQGYQLGHLIDSAFWTFFGKPGLSFEVAEQDSRESD